MSDITEQYLVGLLETAKIASSDTNVKKLVHTVQDILASMSKLQAVNVDGVDPLYLPTEHLLKDKLWREDNVQECPGRDELMANAPAEREGFFLVPKVIE